MAVELKQQLKLAQQLVMTPQLQQAIKLLQLSRIELVDLVQQEMTENPLLESPEISQDEFAEAPDATTPEPPITDQMTAESPAPEPEMEMKEVRPESKEFDSFDWETYLGADRARAGNLPATHETPDGLPTLDATLTKPTSLSEHLIWQLQLSDFSRDEERISREIIGNIDDNGYLKTTLEEITQKEGVSMDFVEDCLAKVQEFDPPGVGARDLRECLLLQSRLLEKSPYLGLVRKVIKNHLDLMTVRNYPALAKVLNTNMERVKIVVKIISEMEPKPGRPFTEENPQYITPDVYVYKVGNDYAIVLNEDGLPKLRISQFYQSALSKDGSVQTKEYIQGKIRSAIWLIKSIHQRQRTVYKTTESIVKYQREFFDKGIAFLKPMILRDVAEDIHMHESTISRVTTNKFVHTPHGIFELKFFFNSSISRNDREDLASEAVKSKIKHLISSENPRKPFSDQEIVEILAESGIEIARRTVAKYREAMGMLSSSKRKRLF